MTIDRQQIPDEALFFIADQHVTVNDVARLIYENPSPKTLEHFRSVNMHLNDGWVQPGQMVIITPPNSKACSMWEPIMMDAAAYVDQELIKLTEQERLRLARNYSLLSNAASYSSTLYGWTHTHFRSKVIHVSQVLKKIENLYVTTYNRTGGIGNHSFFAQRGALFIQLDQAINGMLARQMFGYNVDAARIRSELGLSSKSLVHQWKAQGAATSIPEFRRHYSNLTHSAKIFSRLGYTAIALDVGSGLANIKTACTLEPNSPHCHKIKYSETGGTLGSIGGGFAGGAAGAYGVCNLLLGLPSGGTSLLWCSIVAGASGGYIGSRMGRGMAEDVGETIYHYKVRY